MVSVTLSYAHGYNAWKTHRELVRNTPPVSELEKDLVPIGKHHKAGPGPHSCRARSSDFDLPIAKPLFLMLLLLPMIHISFDFTRL